MQRVQGCRLDATVIPTQVYQATWLGTEVAVKVLCSADGSRAMQDSLSLPPDVLARLQEVSCSLAVCLCEGHAEMTAAAVASPQPLLPMHAPRQLPASWC